MNGERLSATLLDDEQVTAVRDACIQAALTAYENARADGLCHDGAWECAVTAVRTVNVKSMGDEQLLALLRNQVQRG